MTDTEIKILIGVIFLVVIQGSWIFWDASKRGENKWLWGIFGLLNVPSSLIIYLLITRRIVRTMICPHCLYSIKHDSQFCSYCGQEITEDDRYHGKLKKLEQEQQNK